MGYNKFIGMGRLTRDAELKQTGTGIPVISFNVAIDRDIKAQDGTAVDFVDCVAWRKTAEFLDRYFKKGDMIHIEGALQSRNYTDKNNNKRTAWEIQVEKVTFCGKKESSEPYSKGSFEDAAADIPTAEQNAKLDELRGKINKNVAVDEISDDSLPF